jgi:hypothetical protein
MGKKLKALSHVLVAIAVGVLLADLVPDPSGASSTPPSSSSSTSSTSSTVATPPRPITEVPVASDYWPRCAQDADESCWEQATEINENGVEVPAREGGGYAYCHQGKGMSDRTRCAADGSFWLEIGYTNNFDENDVDTTYRWKVRLGKFSPDILMLGNTLKTIVTGDAESGWTLEIWAKPTLKAYKNGCFSPQTCDDKTVAESVSYAINGYLRVLGINEKWPSVSSEELRNSLRGTFISTNGMSQSWTFSDDTFFVTAIGPHFLTDGVTVSPGYVKVFLPESYVIRQRGYASLAEVSTDDLAVTISGKAVTAGIERQEHGLLVDTGVRHFSAPNPTVKLLAKDRSVESPQIGSSTTLPAKATNPTSTSRSLKRGSSVALSSIRPVKSSLAPRWTARGKCAVKGKRLVAASSPGSCSVTLSVKKGTKRTTILRRSYVVS